ncbi:MAG: tetratricopeptide repeat protein [Gammaproteobacteria bacterium]|nr:tetratricopeptide repeat protein [Gammaproteobacteria bacterium]MDH3372563.1 tetratricopeptide repeat protein [Gammaproteobacteria bacterium]MDH3408845.1 tetratricopeptide repeat protein [Gammaproteobacteria bacterium]MDH3553072.1 tetratricopeptide repeat protein [Gammaproteobacteria bacterium]
MTLLIVFAVMSLVAVGFAILPLYRQKRALTPLIGSAVVFVVALSSGLYYYQGQPDLKSAAAALPELADIVGDLAARLESNPGDLNGWKMLGRSYMTMGNYAGAVDAFERAVELESAQDAQTLVSLGEALLASTSTAIDGRIASMFENALALDPNNPQALFYGGIGAFNRNDKDMAADRWERLLALNPPAEIQGILQQRIAEWRGEAAPPVQSTAPAPSAAPGPVESPRAVVTAAISLTDAAAASLPAEATVFVIARDPNQPVPPIAVARRRLSELPAAVPLGDRESMVPGRSLSGFAEFELIARVSVSGQPGAQPGDWFGSQLVKPAENSRIELSIRQQVP